MSAWVCLTDASANRVVLSAPGEHGSAFTLYCSAKTKTWAFNRTDQDKNGPDYIRSLADADNPPLKVWTHLVGVFDTQGDADKGNDTIQLFVNGRPQGKPKVLATPTHPADSRRRSPAPTRPSGRTPMTCSAAR
ncbi:LamG-like jellyroll fold domain-containing protein [Streptomyces sp. NPDC059063]|uniref:LamG-like jellyroll fold domain-containing protein n=1 Tax=unclassified Streptomyces TaxID=2593676 RepID=UPI0036D012F7